jgi:hypothetical protein
MKSLMKQIKQSQILLPKNLIRHLPKQDRWGWQFRRPLPVTDARRWMGWSSLGAQQRKRRKARWVGDPPRITTSHNRLGLSIKHILDTQNHSKNKWQKKGTSEALGSISTDHSRASRGPTPFTMPDEASEHACVSSFLLFFTFLQVHGEQPTI